MVLGALGFLPATRKVDRTIMEHTLDAVRERWRWDTCWGWDFPLAALTASALGRPDEAIDLLLMESPKNTYLANGHNYQDATLPLYLPGNGALLTAVAELCSDGGNGQPNGFSRVDGWAVRCERIHGLH